MTAPLPEFENPPLVETVLGVQFDPLPDLTAFHLGVFWASMGSEWPIIAEGPTLGQTAEPTAFDDVWTAPGPRFPISSATPLRLRGFNSTRDRGFQVENGWLVLNWRKGAGSYPRYAHLRPEFARLFERFVAFIAEQGLGEVRPNLFEIGYINAIPKDGLWTDVGGWHGVLPGLVGSSARTSMGSLQTMNGRWVFDLGQHRGRLHVNLSHAKDDHGGEVLLLRMTARGPVQVPGLAGWSSGLDLGHEAIVRSFSDLTSLKAHELWRRCS